ncbi:MAG: hypothetical protein V7459_07735, partial [Oceanicoccus sp.]
MSKYSPENIQKLIKNVGSASSEALSTQASFYQDSMKRNATCFGDLAKARMTSFQEMAKSKTFTEAFEANAAFEQKVRDDLSALTEETTAAWKDLTSNLQELYTFKEEEVVVAAAAKPKAKKPAKKAVEKTAEKVA